MKVIINVEIEAERIDVEELDDMALAVENVCKEWGHKAEATAKQAGLKEVENDSQE